MIEYKTLIVLVHSTGHYIKEGGKWYRLQYEPLSQFWQGALNAAEKDLKRCATND